MATQPRITYNIDPLFHQIGGGYAYSNLSVGMSLRHPNGEEVYFQPGDDSWYLRREIDTLLDLSEDRANRMADAVLGEYFL